MNDTTTPTRITSQILDFCQSIKGAESPPYFVPVKPVSNDLDECINIVNAHVQTNGGVTLIGWIIWEWPYTLVEAELHAIWGSPTGEKIDLSPKRDGEKRILFLPDPSQTFPERTRVPNVRMALRDHPRIQEFIRLSDKQKSLLPPPGQPFSFGPGHPIVAIERQMLPVIEELRRMSNVRRKSNWRKGKR